MVYIVGLGKTGTQSAEILQSSGAEVILWDDDMHQRNASKDLNLPFSPRRRLNGQRLIVCYLALASPICPPCPSGRHLSQPIRLKSFAMSSFLCGSFLPPNCLPSPAPMANQPPQHYCTIVLKTAKKKVQIGGNFGIPILTLQPPTEDSYVVVELSSYQLERIPS